MSEVADQSGNSCLEGRLIGYSALPLALLAVRLIVLDLIDYLLNERPCGAACGHP
jgi:hypothetical protein